jgi:1,4-dihydroxy-2-naphthoate octaprenyltransferase
MPCLLGGLIALSHGQFSALLFVTVLVGLIAANAATNFLDDYFDYAAGVAFKSREFTGFRAESQRQKCRFMLEGRLVPESVLYAGMGCLTVAALIGIYLTLVSGWVVLVLAVAGGLVIFFYSAPPIKLGYRGVGEIFVALAMGPGITLGTYYVLTQTVSLEPVIASIPVGVLIGTMLYVHGIPDFDADKSVGKETLTVRLGSSEKAVRVLPLFLTISYGSIVLGVVTKMLPPITLIVFLSTPIAYKMIKSVNTSLKEHFESISNYTIMMDMPQRLYMMAATLLCIAYIIAYFS